MAPGVSIANVKLFADDLSAHTLVLSLSFSFFSFSLLLLFFMLYLGPELPADIVGVQGKECLSGSDVQHPVALRQSQDAVVADSRSVEASHAVRHFCGMKRGREEGREEER